MHRVLVIEDELLVRELICYQLENAGFLVSSAGDGPSGLASARKERPDAVVLDVKMPGMDGREVLRRLKEIHPRLSVFVFSARADAPRVAEGLKGADGNFPKSADMGDLIRAIGRAVGRGEAPV
jgi:two-component system OmpR family response regulator